MQPLIQALTRYYTCSIIILKKLAMEQMIFSQINSQSLINQIVEQVTAKVLEAVQANEAEVQPDIFDKYIPKTEVRGKLASSSTLWSWENKGKLKLYAIGGKRFYKRTDIEALFKEVDKKGVTK